MKISFEIHGSQCKTPCPHGPLVSVGSNGCQLCSYFVSRDIENMEVECCNNGGKSKVPDKPGKIPDMPECKPTKNPGRDRSKDAEIKMEMAKDILLKYMDYGPIQTKDLDDTVWFSCSLAEQIFNRFHKGDE